MFGNIKYAMKKKLKIKNSYFVGIGAFSAFLMIGGFSFALFTTTAESRGALNIVTGNLYSLLESNDLENGRTIRLNSGESRMITITLKNVNTVDAKLNLYYDAAEGVNVSYDSTKDTPPTTEGSVIAKNASKQYKLKITNNTPTAQAIAFDSNVGLSNKTLDFPSDKKCIDEVIPIVELDDAMIKVVYDDMKNSWVKADNSNWYNYDLGRWANAVTVTSTTRDTYQSAQAGTIINMNDIETMWVWIPRYSYTIGSMDGTSYYGKQGAYLSTAPTQALPGEIDIKFIAKDKKDTGSAQYRVASGIAGFKTPDAFTFGEEELSGIWVGKFETSSSTPSAIDGGGNTTTLDTLVKPNVPSWRGIQVANLAEVGRNITKANNRYGFSTDTSSHAMKNIEWASVAYLSQSKYGKLGNTNYIGANKEIYQNKSNQYITGCSYGAPGNSATDYGCQYTYNVTSTGTGASTTGTIYGIYDMSGGSWDYTLANYTANGNKYSGNSTINNSGYTGLTGVENTNFSGKDWLDNKFYDFYTTNNALTACNNKPCLSHGLHETSSWYQDTTTMIEGNFPWIVRGGYYADSIISGIFGVGRAGGELNSSFSFRLVLNKT